jgi:two-component system, OmpR family, phosphate regulon response regulator PhoB
MIRDHYFSFEKEINSTQQEVKDFTGKKILIVDDEKEIRDLLKETLTIDNFSVFEAESGTTALQSVEENQPDLVLMDVVMPGKLNGLDVCKKIKNEFKTKDIPIVFLTAFPVEENQTRELCNIDYFYKPFSPIKLVDKIYDVLDKKKV